MKVVVNPKYAHLCSWIESIPLSFEAEGSVIYKGRNVIKVMSSDGIEFNIKKYKKPHIVNRFVYTFFRKSKPFRAYHNGLRIQEKGFDTAESVAYMEINRGGLFSDSYYVSLQCLGTREIREYYSGPLSGNEALIDEFARYSAKLHDAGIYHLDYSPGNILIREDGTFILVDVNRMKFIRVSPDKGCRNFARLFEHDDMYERIGMVYSQSRKEPFSPEKAVELILKYRKAFLHKKACTRKIKTFFKSLAPR